MTLTADRVAGKVVPACTETLPCEDSSAPKARAFALDALSAWGINGSPTQEAVLLIVSELATNAVKHSGRETFEIQVSCPDTSTIKVLVADAGRSVPVLSEPTDESENGRGLWLVDVLSVRWGYERGPEGKAVWAEVSAAADPWCALEVSGGAS